MSLDALSIARSSRWSTRWLPPAAILLLTFLAYSPILRAGFIWDDDKHITANTLLRDADGLRTLWLDRQALPQYYPLTHTFFWIEYHLWGEKPLGYHAVNLLLHACNATLVWLILQRLQVTGAFLAALFFAVHPVNVETVGWIAERKNTLSGFFYLCSLLVYLRYEAKPGSGPLYVMSFILFLCSLLCKSVTCTLPAALLVIFWWRDGRIRMRDFVALLPFFAAGAVLGLHTAYLERTHVASFGPEWRFATTIPGEAVARCLIAGRAIWFYFLKLLAPYPLMFEYPRWQINIASAAQYVFPFFALAALVALWKLRSRLGRGPLAAMLFFIGTLFPALGFANLYPMRFSFVADHFQYLASIGPMALAAAGLAKLSRRRGGHYLPTELLVGILGMLTFFRTFAFHDEATLYADSIAKNPRGWMCQTNFGVILGRQGNWDAAIPHLLMGIHLHPINASAADELGQIALAKNQPDQAVIWFRRAIKMEPKLGIPHYNLAGLLESNGDIPGALREYALTVQLQHNHAPAHLDFGVLLAKQSRFAEAIDQFNEALRIAPASGLARRDLIAALEQSGRLGEAVDQIHLLLEQHPDDAPAYDSLGLAEAALHHRDSAIAAFTRALEINPDLPEARQHLHALLNSPTTQN